ncbi:hypothetical protein QFZ98_005155 [Paraburkholderia youngii]
MAEMLRSFGTAAHSDGATHLKDLPRVDDTDPPSLSDWFSLLASNAMNLSPALTSTAGLNASVLTLLFPFGSA